MCPKRSEDIHARGAGFTRSGDHIELDKFQPPEKGECSPAFHRAPAYPFFMAVIYRFFGLPKEELSEKTWHINWDRVRLAQCILDSLCCLLVFFVVRLLYSGSPWPSLIASAFYAFSFYNIFYTRELLSETVTAFLVTSFALISIISIKRGTIRTWFFAGIIFGAVPLSRPEYLPFAGFFAVFIWFIYRPNPRSAIKNMLVFLIGAACIIAPWSIRNYMVFKKPIVISTGGFGEGFYLGTVGVSADTWKWGELPQDEDLTPEEKEDVVAAHKGYFGALNFGTINDVEKIDNFYISLALKRIKNHPFKVLENWVTKIPRLWYQNYVPKYRKKEASGRFFIFYLVFAIYGFFAAKRSERLSMVPIIFLPIYLTFIFLPIEVEPRYSAPLMPVIISLAGIGGWDLFKLVFAGTNK